MFAPKLKGPTLELYSTDKHYILKTDDKEYAILIKESQRETRTTIYNNNHDYPITSVERLTEIMNLFNKLIKE